MRRAGCGSTGALEWRNHAGTGWELAALALMALSERVAWIGPVAAGVARYLLPVVEMPWMNVFWAKKNRMMIGIVKIVEAAINCAKKPP